MNVWALWLVHQARTSIQAEKARLATEVRAIVERSECRIEESPMARDVAWTIVLLGGDEEEE